jgi:hypothetical protein
MELPTVTQLLTKNHIPVFGIESKSKVETKSKQKSGTEETSAEEIGTKELSNEDRCCRVAELAYYKAESRGFEPGHELDDWLAAEAEVTQ